MSNLQKEIDAYKEAFVGKVPVELRKIMLNATKELEDVNISKDALKVGEVMKSFTLPNALGENINLSDVLSNNDFVVVNFYRGVWCPYCNLELKALQSIVPQLSQLNTALIAVSPQTADASLSTKEKNELSFEVLSDEKNKIAKEFGLVFVLADALKPIYAKFCIDIQGLNQDDSFELPMPATFVLNKKAEVIFAFVDEDYTKRMEPKTILDIIAQNK